MPVQPSIWACCTSISPCPLATNIAAISYVGRKVGDSRAVIAAGFLYTAGRCLLYIVLATLVATTAMSIPAVSLFLQKYMHLALGPVFLLLGMFLVGLITANFGGASMTEGLQKRIDTMGVWGICRWAYCSRCRSARRRQHGSLA